MFTVVPKSCTNKGSKLESIVSTFVDRVFEQLEGTNMSDADIDKAIDANDGLIDDMIDELMKKNKR